MGRVSLGRCWIYDHKSIMRQIFISKLKNFALFGLITIMIGCGSAQPVPVINKSPDRIIPEAYQVKSGDSIYNIAWSFGVDYADIAEWSEIKAPYKLNPGQVVYLHKPTVKITALSSGLEDQGAAVATSLPEVELAPVPQTSTTPIHFSKSPGKWNWPAEGNLAGKFSPSSGRNGIQITGTKGSVVKATAAGQVVYVGEGLRGYGKLIILKHSDAFLSAYAHNENIIVREGENIASEQQIATMGDSGAQSTMLHFEIRKEGQPVDPLIYLK